MDITALDSVRIELAPGGQIILPIILAIMMFSIALNLYVRDFQFLLMDPWRFLGAGSFQIIALPLVSLGLCYLINPPASVALGMIVVACCPGGTVSNFLTHLAKGDTALSVSLTATSSLFAAFLTPLSILIWSGLYEPTDNLLDTLDINPISFVAQTTIILAIPIALGMTLAHFLPNLAKRIRTILQTTALVGLVIMAAGGVASNWDLLTGVAVALIWIAVLHNAVAFLIGAFAGRLLRYDQAKRRTMIFEVGIQNTGLGLVLLLGQFEGLGGAAAITGIWSIWHLISGAMLVGGFRVWDRFKLY